MSQYAEILKPSRVALILFALSVIIAVAVVAGLAQYRSAKEQTISQMEGKLGSTRDQIRRLTYDLDSINRLAEKYRQIGQLGFIGEADRDAWMERLEVIYRNMHLPPTLRYTLAPPQLLNQQAADTALDYQKNILHHDLAIELSDIHEGELLDFIGRLNTGWQTPYRVESCHITREALGGQITGLKIKCTLQIFSLPYQAKGS